MDPTRSGRANLVNQPAAGRFDRNLVAGILRALGNALPEDDLRRLDAFLTGGAALDVGQDRVRAIVDALKAAADRHWRIDPHRSAELADVIIAIADAVGDPWTRALGMMAKGDAIKFIGAQQEAWDLLETAGRQFSAAGDEVGWARTWIGRLFVAAQLGRLPEAIEQTEQARAIFARHGERLRLLRIDMALGEVSLLAENHALAEAHYQRALAVALGLAEQGEHETRAIYNSLGLIAQSRGDPYRALDYFDQVARLARAQGEETAESICRLNTAMARIDLGHFRQALALLNEIRPRYRQLFGADTQIQLEMAQCLVALDRHEEAAALYRQARQEWLAGDARLSAARTAMLQAMAEARLGDMSGAHALLSAAEEEFAGLGDNGLTLITRLRRGQLALRSGDAAQALALARACGAGFGAAGQAPYQAEALLLEGDALLNLDQLDGAGSALSQALDRASACASPALVYSAHLSLGRLAERQGRQARALRRYAAAEATLERMQRNLTVALRPAFLANKLDAQRARVLLQLQLGDVAGAFETVERVRTQIAQGYLSGRETLRWESNDVISVGLAGELDQLRGRHHALAERARDTAGADRAALGAIERQMRAIADQLRLRRPADAPDAAAAPSVPELQRALGENEAMLAYFDDGARMRVFVIGPDCVEQISLEINAAEVARELDQLERNLSRALTAGPARAHAALLKPARSILQRLWAQLVGPVAPMLRGQARIFIVPYGPLHALPFNLLHDGAGYLIEQAEIVTLPGAALLLRRAPRRPDGARVIVHDDAGRLPDVEREAEVIQTLFPTTALKGAAATRVALRAPPARILHIAAHGAYRTDNPDFSHIALADGQLLIDDLLQMDLSYELVTLSACETGRGRVTAGDETLGIGWAFLYAGAGAVVSSLWRVSDARTAPLMAGFYGALHNGLSKSSALRAAQLRALAEDPGAHPAFWGAFQLLGSPAALSRDEIESGGPVGPRG